MIKKILHVCVPARDRSILTKKCIESIHLNFSKFDRIKIYLFDNCSVPTPERFKIFTDLMRSNKIYYYSHDSLDSCHNCFPKAVIFNRFIDMMTTDFKINGDNNNIKNYYMLSDNDMIYGPDVDDYFISGLHLIENSYKNIRFLVKAPGGVPKAARDQGMYFAINSMYTNSKFNAIFATAGGGGGFWFMNHTMLASLKWTSKELKQTKHKFKMHDVITWKKIKQQQGDTAHVCALVPIDSKVNPLVIHLGGKAGSICNSLTNNSYSQIKEQSKVHEETITNLSASEIFEKYKHLGEW